MVNLLFLWTEFLNHHMKSGRDLTCFLEPLGIPNAFLVTTTGVENNTVPSKAQGGQSRVLATAISVYMQWVIRRNPLEQGLQQRSTQRTLLDRKLKSESKFFINILKNDRKFRQKRIHLLDGGQQAGEFVTNWLGSRAREVSMILGVFLATPRTIGSDLVGPNGLLAPGLKGTIRAHKE